VITRWRLRVSEIFSSGTSINRTNPTAINYTFHYFRLITYWFTRFCHLHRDVTIAGKRLQSLHIGICSALLHSEGFISCHNWLLWSHSKDRSIQSPLTKCKGMWWTYFNLDHHGSLFRCLLFLPGSLRIVSIFKAIYKKFPLI
jgi:hypothetical protein